MEGIVVGVIVGAAGLAINAFVRRMGVKTRTDRLEESMGQVAKTQRVILKCLLPMLVKLKGKALNGELEEALEELNNHLISKG